MAGIITTIQIILFKDDDGSNIENKFIIILS